MLETSGPVILALPLSTFSHFNIFLEKIRPQVNIGNSDFCFLSWSGKRLTSSEVREQLKTFWRSATGKPMDTALMRKSCVTQVHYTRPDMKVKVLITCATRLRR